MSLEEDIMRMTNRMAQAARMLVCQSPVRSSPTSTGDSASRLKLMKATVDACNSTKVDRVMPSRMSRDDTSSRISP